MEGMILEKYYREALEERLIAFLAEMKGISLETAMRVYYSSRLAEKIHAGANGVQYLDEKVLAQILCETEPELFDEQQEETNNG